MTTRIVIPWVCRQRTNHDLIYRWNPDFHRVEYWDTVEWWRSSLGSRRRLEEAINDPLAPGWREVPPPDATDIRLVEEGEEMKGGTP